MTRAPLVATATFVTLAVAGGLGAQAPAMRWTRVLPPGHGAFEDAWRPGRWPLGAHPVAGPSSRLWMLGTRTVWESDDGRAWRVAARLPPRLGATPVLHSGRLWLLGGQVGGEFVSEVRSSAEGRSWDRRPDAPWPARRGAAAASFGGWLWLFGGEAAEHLSDVWRSRDGIAWQRVLQRAPWPPESQPIVVALRDSLWAFGGSSWDARVADLWVSADGERWEQVVAHAPWGPRAYPGVVAFDGALWVLGGVRPGGDRLADVWTSATGRDWRRAAAPWTRRAGNRAVVYRGALWLFGGKGDEADGRSGYASDIWRLQPASPRREGQR